MLARTLCWALLVLGVGSPGKALFVEETSECHRERVRNGWNLVFFRPFYVCGRVQSIESSYNFSNVRELLPVDWGCTIGCVRRTSDTVRVRLMACFERPYGPLFDANFSGMRFRSCTTETQYTLLGTDALNWILITIEPNTNCLRNRVVQGTCTRIFNYDRQDSLIPLKGLFEERQINVGLQKALWKTLSKNRAGCPRLGLSVRLFVVQLMLYCLLWRDT